MSQTPILGKVKVGWLRNDVSESLKFCLKRRVFRPSRHLHRGVLAEGGVKVTLSPKFKLLENVTLVKLHFVNLL